MAVTVYNLKVKKYSNGHIQTVKYSKLLSRVKPGLELSDRSKLMRRMTSNNNPTSKKIKTEKEIRRDSITRSCTKLADAILANSHDLHTFITLTFKENIKDLTIANKDFNLCMKAIRYRYPSFKYIAVPEFQKRGAVHYHLLTNLKVSDDLVITKQDAQKDMYDVIQWKHGFTSVFDLSLTDDNFNLTSYMMKYLWKDIDNRLFGRRKILLSSNLDKPIESYILEDSEEYNDLILQVKNKEILQNKRVVSIGHEGLLEMNFIIYSK